MSGLRRWQEKIRLVLGHPELPDVLQRLVVLPALVESRDGHGCNSGYGRADGGTRKTIPLGVSIGAVIRGQTNDSVKLGDGPPGPFFMLFLALEFSSCDTSRDVCGGVEIASESVRDLCFRANTEGKPDARY